MWKNSFDKFSKTFKIKTVKHNITDIVIFLENIFGVQKIVFYIEIIEKRMKFILIFDSNKYE